MCKMSKARGASTSEPTFFWAVRATRSPIGTPHLGPLGPFTPSTSTEGLAVNTYPIVQLPV